MPATVRAGGLVRRVTIQKPTVVGGITKWITLATVWAEIAPVSGAEVARALAPSNVLMSLVTIRYRSDVSVKQRLLYGTRILEIISVITPDEAQIALELVVKEVQT